MATHTLDFERPLLELERQIEEMKRVQVARHPKRPYTLDYMRTVFSDFVELHGDRLYRDDPAIVGGWARLDGASVMLIGHQKGRDTKENLRRNFGMAHPEGYRKALRLMRLAEKFGAPVVTLVDTPGAYPGLGAEERGQAEAIARNLLEMAGLKTPTITAVIGEGGSGGALAVGLADRVIMFENSVYSVISPEGCAAILWKDASQRERAAEALKLTAEDLLDLGVIDEIVPEPPGGAHADPEAADQPLAVQDPVIVEADRGEDFGRVSATGALAARKCGGGCHGCSLAEPAPPATPERRIVRRASPDDVRRAETLRSEEETVRLAATERARAHHLPIKLSDAEWQWDRRKLTIYFTADQRVDFRALVRDLASLFRARIELRQIGARDEAKRLDGVGRCGRQYCCSSWLPELRPVS